MAKPISDKIKNIKARYDAFMNISSGWGTAADPLVQTRYKPGELFPNTELETMFRWDWLIRKVMTVIPGDAVRQGITMNAEDENIIKDMNERIDKLDMWEKKKEAMTWARLYGGAVIIIGALDGQNVSEELNEDTIKEISFLNVMDRWQLYVKDRYTDPLSGKYGKPKTYTLQPIIHGGSGLGDKLKQILSLGSVIHESRLLRFDGAKLPDILTYQNQGWADSIIVGISETFKQYGVSIRAGSVLMMDFITKVLKIPNLNELIMNQDQQTIETRLQYAIANMSSLGLTLIGNDEEFVKIQNPIRGMVEMVDKYIEIMSAATDIPRTRLFGQQLGKLAGATEMTRAYYDIVQDYQVDHVKKPTDRLLSLLLKDPTVNPSKKEPEGWSWDFNSLWQHDPKTQAETRKLQAETDQIYIQNQVLSPDEVGVSRFGSGEWSAETTLDMEAREDFKEGSKIEPEPEPTE
jgi:phage-related protein (TIGR01555 family)